MSMCINFCDSGSGKNWTSTDLSIWFGYLYTGYGSHDVTYSFVSRNNTCFGFYQCSLFSKKLSHIHKLKYFVYNFTRRLLFVVDTTVSIGLTCINRNFHLPPILFVFVHLSIIVKSCVHFVNRHKDYKNYWI